jgi:uncharacterized protein (TIGR03067 family)
LTETAVKVHRGGGMTFHANLVRCGITALVAFLMPIDDPRAAADAEAIQGQWLMTRAVIGGEPSDGQVGRARYFFHTRDYIKSLDEKVIIEGEYTIDPTKSPRSIDLIQTMTEPPTRWLGIYDLDGDVLKLAFSGRPDLRPESFATKVGVAGFCFTLKRVRD